MENFPRQTGILHCEGTSLVQLAEAYETPLYVYSKNAIKQRFAAFAGAFKSTEHLICFAAKANTNIAIMNLIGQLGSGADIVSGGELYRCLKAGISPTKIVYSGVGKTEGEIVQALNAGILMFNVESLQELYLLDRVAGECGRRAPISIRINPDIDAKTHPYVATGLRTSKFGIGAATALAAYDQAKKLKSIEVVGVDCHIGSQLTSLAPFVEAAKRLRELVLALRAQGFNIRYLDVGGGLGITYNAESPPSPAEYGAALLTELGDLAVTLILEPGRHVVGNAGILLSRVLYTKNNDKQRFIVIDAGMNDLMRPALYGSHHGIQPVVERKGSSATVDVVGPICETGDFLAKARSLPPLEPGDLIAITSAGAYGTTMSSEYNSRPKAAEILVDKHRHYIIRERGTYEDLLRGERIPT